MNCHSAGLSVILATLMSGCTAKVPATSEQIKSAADCAFSGDGGKVGPGTVVLLSTMEKLNLRNPISDLDANLATGDRRFIGINGYSCDEPGLGGDHGSLVARFHTHCLEGTGDVVENNLHFSLIDAATAYAKLYNAELARRIHAGAVT